MIPMRLKHDIERAMERPVAKLRGRLRGLVTRFVLGKTSRATGDLARARGEGFYGDASDSDEVMQPYGHASMPVAGAEGVRVSVFGDGDHGVVVVLDDRRYRPDLADGETAQYHLSGSIVHMKADGSINVVPALSGLVHLGADPGSQFVALAADVKDRLDELQVAHDTHNHPTAPNGPVSVPSVLVGDLDPVAATKVKAS
jgi:hypothetical protein